MDNIDPLMIALPPAMFSGMGTRDEIFNDDEYMDDPAGFTLADGYGLMTDGDAVHKGVVVMGDQVGTQNTLVGVMADETIGQPSPSKLQTPKKVQTLEKIAEHLRMSNHISSDMAIDSFSDRSSTPEMRFEEQSDGDMIEVPVPKTSPSKCKTPAKKKPKTTNSTVESPNQTGFESTPSKTLNITAMTFEEQEDEQMVDAPVNTTPTPAKRKISARENAATETPTKTRRTAAKKIPCTTATEDTSTMERNGGDKYFVGVEKSDNIIMF
jgi:hypothetical protein